MNKKRIVQLRDPKLLKIRYNFRQLFAKVVQKEISTLILRQRLLLDENHGTRFNEKLYEKLSREEIKLSEGLRRFIGVCSSCSDRRKDHIFNPKDKMWYCEECYTKFSKLYNSYEFYKPNAFP